MQNQNILNIVNFKYTLTSAQAQSPAFIKIYSSPKCSYFKHYYGTLVKNCDGKFIELIKVVDHFIPYHICRCTEISNLVICCNLCNVIKNKRSFPTLDDAIQHISKRFHLLYEIIDEPTYLDVNNGKYFTSYPKPIHKIQYHQNIIQSLDDDIYEKYSLYEILEIYNLL